jgi:hypothetical protein
MNALAAGAGYRLAWREVHGPVNDGASQRAREGDLTHLRQMFETITRDRAGADPQETARPALAASRASHAAQATEATEATAKRPGPSRSGRAGGYSPSGYGDVRGSEGRGD